MPIEEINGFLIGDLDEINSINTSLLYSFNDYEIPQDIVGPYIVSSAIYQQGTDSQTHVVPYPSLVQVGDYMVIFMCIDGSNNTVPAAPSGWTRVLGGTTSSVGFARYIRTATETDTNASTVTFTTGNNGFERAAAIFLNLRNVTQAAYQIGTFSTTLIPSISWAARTSTLTLPTLWMKVAMSNVPRTVTTHPSLYNSTDFLNASAGSQGSALGSMVNIWWKHTTQQSEAAQTVTYNNGVQYTQNFSVEFI